MTRRHYRGQASRMRTPGVLGLIAVLLAAGAEASPATAPEALPPVTVRYEDPGQREVFIVEGADYQCRVALCPARVLSLRVGGKDLLGPGGMTLAFEDERGNRYSPAPPDVVPNWKVWRRAWVPASDARARMNVWSAGPYYWDAHVLDIPLVTDAYARALATPGPALADWTFDDGPQGWQELHNCTVAGGAGGTLTVTVSGDDPYLQCPPLAVPGPVTVVFRMRTREGGGAAFYWFEDREAGYSGEHVVTFPTSGDGEWHEYRVGLPAKGSIRGIRFDPPGNSGRTDLDWVRLLAAPPGQETSPTVRGEIVLHAYPDQLRLELRADPGPGQPRLRKALLQVEAPPVALPSRKGRPLGTLTAGGVSVAVLGSPGATCDRVNGVWTAPLQGVRATAYWVIRPLPQGKPPVEAFADELEPLPPSAVDVSGGHWLGYEPASGLYRMTATPNLPAYGFEPAYMNPGRRVETRVHLRNGTRPRRLLVKCLTGIGCLEAALLADRYGFPLPVPVSVAKNFAGELEEPDDSAFGDSYFPLAVAAGEQRNFQVLHLMQNWGNHPLKQVSSIRFFHIYWHLSTGASESTCFTHDWMQTGTGSVFHIPDFRPLSGPLWRDQPQHDCQQWPGFLQYNGGAGRLMYERTAFQSLSPCVARFTAYYHTSDKAATARVSYLEAPQRDEMRTFIRLRYDWQQPVKIEGDARLSFRWLNICEFRHSPAALLWTDAAGKTQTRPVTASDEPLLRGEPLAREAPFLASQGRGEDYGCVVLVRGFRAHLGGRDFDQAAASAQFGKSSGDYWLTVPTEQLQLAPGDFLEAEVMLMPHGEPALPEFKPERERAERFGAGQPAVKEVTQGAKVADFPATVRAADEVAEFTVTGGFDYMPLIVEGFRGWGVPLLWVGGLWQDQQVRGGDGYQVEPDGNGGYRFLFVYPIRKDQEHHMLVTRAECTTGIARLRDVNGRPRLEAPAPGVFSLRAPVLFAPGCNTVTAGSSTIAFAGTASAVQAVPVAVSLTNGRAEVQIAEGGMDLTVKGAPATISFRELAPGAGYLVSVDGKATRQVAVDGSLLVRTRAARCHITVARESRPPRRDRGCDGGSRWPVPGRGGMAARTGKGVTHSCECRPSPQGKWLPCVSRALPSPY